METLRVEGNDIVQLREWDGELMTREQLFPTSSRADWDVNQHWLAPDYWNPIADIAILVSQTYAFTSGGLKILIDTGIGNGKNRPIPPWNHLETDFADKLTKAGYAPDSVDVVICTHLHNDHVGWNTRWVDNQWTPTFPNARYVFHHSDLDRFEKLSPTQDPFGDLAAFNDSVKPIIEAGLTQLWEGDSYQINSELKLLNTPGHTAGNSVVVHEHAGAAVIWSGDVVQHPMQIVNPQMSSVLDDDAETAEKSRRRILNLAADLNAVVLPAHFPANRGPRVAAKGNDFTIKEWVPLL